MQGEALKQAEPLALPAADREQEAEPASQPTEWGGLDARIGKCIPLMETSDS